jgi:DNA-binding GntR family transcriptional regulator
MLAASTRERSNGNSLNSLAYQQIREKIVALDLPPASLVDEARLADELGVGLTPVRQALRRLALENLVVILPRRGTIVADLNLSDLHKIFEMRVELEALAAQLAAERATPEQLANLAALVQEAQRRNAAGSKRELLDLDHRMHRLLAECAHNEFLEETLDRLYSHILRLWNLLLHRVTSLPASLQEHRAIAAAVTSGDGLRAAELMRAHVRHFQQEIADLQMGRT